MKKILLVTGTNREDSQTKKLSLAVKKIYEEEKISTDLLDLSNLSADWFTPKNYAIRKDKERPEAKKWLEADGLLMILPEYNGSYPGVIKHFIDMLPFPDAMAGKKIAFIGLSSGPSAGSHAVEQMQLVFLNRRAFIYPIPVFIGELKEPQNLAEDVIKRIKDQSVGFLNFINKL